MGTDLKDKDYAFLKAVFESNGEATTSDIREYTENHTGVVTLDNPAINYRCRSLGTGDETVSGDGFVEVEKGGTDDSGRPQAKTVRIVDMRRDEVERRIDEYDSEHTVDGFGSVDDAFRHLLDQVQEQDERIAELEAENETLMTEMEAMEDDFAEAIRTLRSEMGEDDSTGDM